jgi:TruD family tRNA pseudouridine synthase
VYNYGAIMNMSQEEFIESVAKERPDAFKSPTVIEDAGFLRPYGIYIPGKEKFPLGVIKHRPEDFIVEEVQTDGSVADISFKEIEPVFTDAPFIHATIVKCGISTLEVIEDLSKALGCQKTDIGYAGIKDKEAVTSQRISIRNVKVERLLALKAPNYFLKDLKGATESIKKGVIRGNRFTLYIRTEQTFFEQGNTQAFVERLATIKNRGFYNFYYLQRFGMPRLANITVGLHIMRGDYDKAIHAIITHPSDLESPFMRETRVELAKAFGNWQLCQEIVKNVPELFRNELTIINYLSKKPNNWSGALQQLLDKVSINVYSVPSLFFNEYISSKLEIDIEPPKELPLLLSDDKRDIDLYTDMLKGIGLYPFTGRCLRPFSIIRFMKRLVPTKDIPELHGASVTDEGVVLSFSLGKGQYATTFLSHLFNLVSGEAPNFVTDKIIDSKEILEIGDLRETVERFSETLKSKSKFRDFGAGATE